VKKFPSLKAEYANLIENLEPEPTQGTAMADSCYKIRIGVKAFFFQAKK